MKMLQGIKKRITTKLQAWKDKKLLQELVTNPDNWVRQVGKSIQFVTESKELNEEENNLIKSIENLRKALENSDEVVTVKDFGAGSPDLKLSISEMESGILSQRIIKDICLNASSSPKVGQLIFRIILNIKPKRCLELGTSLGISGAYQLAALKINNKGELITIEGSENISKIAQNNFSKLGFSNFKIYNGSFKDVLLEILSKEKLYDLVFIDGHHDKVATKQYFEQIYPSLDEKAILIFDDIYWSKGMSEVWKEIYTDNRVNNSIDIGRWGICYINKSIKPYKVNYQKINF
jgi:predicted O-methyltransferase YrrM